mmetsp:Transcript_103608/g.259837  ORF Transcript_103608/g.259837 Transcript_103608/m.259837 type:complete len:262 (-) Transcript_103608:1373-2158(-)
MAPKVALKPTEVLATATVLTTTGRLGRGTTKPGTRGATTRGCADVPSPVATLRNFQSGNGNGAKADTGWVANVDAAEATAGDSGGKIGCGAASLAMCGARDGNGKALGTSAAAASTATAASGGGGSEGGAGGREAKSNASKLSSLTAGGLGSSSPRAMRASFRRLSLATSLATPRATWSKWKSRNATPPPSAAPSSCASCTRVRQILSSVSSGSCRPNSPCANPMISSLDKNPLPSRSYFWKSSTLSCLKARADSRLAMIW